MAVQKIKLSFIKEGWEEVVDGVHDGFPVHKEIVGCPVCGEQWLKVEGGYGKAWAFRSAVCKDCGGGIVSGQMSFKKTRPLRTIAAPREECLECGDLLLCKQYETAHVRIDWPVSILERDFLLLMDGHKGFFAHMAPTVFPLGSSRFIRWTKELLKC